MNCCARYMFNSRLLHKKALKRSGRYLKAPGDRVLIINLSRTLKVNSYPDSDFARLYGQKKQADAACVKGRTGFLISLSGCPVLCISKLYKETAFSAIEAKINILAHYCLELFPVTELVGEIGSVVSLPTENMASLHFSPRGQFWCADWY